MHKEGVKSWLGIIMPAITLVVSIACLCGAAYLTKVQNDRLRDYVTLEMFRQERDGRDRWAGEVVNRLENRIVNVEQMLSEVRQDMKLLLRQRVGTQVPGTEGIIHAN